MSIDALPAAPAATDPVDTFDAKAFAFNAALQNFRTQANATADAMQINADILAAVLLGMALPDYAGTSASSFAVGTGSKTFATQTGKLWTVGQIVVVSNGANLMRGPVTGYSAGNLTVNVTSIAGSGTFSSWTIGLTFDGLLVAKSGANNDITSLGALTSVTLQQPGEICLFARNTAPAGFLKANGALVSRTTYATLFAAIGTTFGVGDGSTTFGLPDLRGEFLRAWDDARGVDSGRGFGTAQLDQIQGHGHTAATLSGGTQVPSYGSGAPVSVGAQAALAPITDGTNGTPRVGAETRPRNVALLACIKF